MLITLLQSLYWPLLTFAVVAGAFNVSFLVARWRRGGDFRSGPLRAFALAGLAATLAILLPQFCWGEGVFPAGVIDPLPGGGYHLFGGQRLIPKSRAGAYLVECVWIFVSGGVCGVASAMFLKPEKKQLSRPTVLDRVLAVPSPKIDHRHDTAVASELD